MVGAILNENNNEVRRMQQRVILLERYIKGMVFFLSFVNGRVRPIEKQAVLLITLMFLLGCSPKEQHGINPAFMETPVDPARDFYHHANGGGLKKNEIPPSESSWGSFEEI